MEITTLEHIFKKYPEYECSTPNEIFIKSMSRNDLPILFHELGFNHVAEIGVESGRFSKVLLMNNPGSKLYAIDSWKAYRAYRDHVRQPKIDQMLVDARERLKGLRVQFIQAFSVDAAKNFKDGTLDAVFIDANHRYEFVVADLAAWVPKVRPGGIVSGHDWFKDLKPGAPYNVIPAVRGYVESHNIHPLFIACGDPGKAKSWFFIKE